VGRNVIGLCFFVTLASGALPGCSTQNHTENQNIEQRIDSRRSLAENMKVIVGIQDSSEASKVLQKLVDNIDYNKLEYELKNSGFKKKYTHTGRKYYNFEISRNSFFFPRSKTVYNISIGDKAAMVRVIHQGYL